MESRIISKNPSKQECLDYLESTSGLASMNMLTAFQWSERERALFALKSHNKPHYNPLFDEPTNKLKNIMETEESNYKNLFVEPTNKTYTRKENGMLVPIEDSPRKSMPLFSGVLKYFPDALLEVSKVSLAGNKQHKNGDELKWEREKSSDHMDAFMRHLTDYAKGNEVDDDGLLHLSKCCWRIMAQLQLDLENKKQ